MKELNIDATNAILGRLASYSAKQALLGYTINIVHAEKAIISGNPVFVHEKYYHRIFERGRPSKGPFLSRMPDRFVRRTIRGMLEYKSQRGKDAFDRIMCYIGVPVELKDKKFVKVTKEASKLPTLRYQSVAQLCASLGGTRKPSGGSS